MLKTRSRCRKIIREEDNKTTWISKGQRGCTAIVACGFHPCLNSKKTLFHSPLAQLLFYPTEQTLFPMYHPYTDSYLVMKRRGLLWESNLGTGFIVFSKITRSRCFSNDSFCRKTCNKCFLLIQVILRWWKMAVPIYVTQVSHWEGSAQLLLCL